MPTLTAHPTLQKVTPKIFADSSRCDGGMSFRFYLNSIKHLLSEPINPAVYLFPKDRKHDLWKRTCFEVFLAQPNQEKYIEINANAEGAWNIYFFDSYREPQPPQEFHGAHVSRIECGADFFELEFNWPQIPNKLKLSLCAVILTKEGPLYYSTAHLGTKPDFHLRESFTLRSEL